MSDEIGSFSHELRTIACGRSSGETMQMFTREHHIARVLSSSTLPTSNLLASKAGVLHLPLHMP